ncbi:hypothetical protein ACF1AE_19595 [Streptomyces sp. NPDC014986]|uniref:hypothetical protein n=1 Tax=Streptomyces sp. NPDC014986 TaxID=3364934 RepID=UPI0036FD3E05
MSAPDNAANRIPPGARGFDDLRVGMVTGVGVPPASEVAGPSLLSAITQAPPVPDAVMAGVRWEQGPRAGAAGVRAEGVLTRWKPARKRGSGRLHQDVRLLDAGGQVVESAFVVWDVPAGTDVRDDESASRVAWDVGSVAWGRHLAAALADNEAFASAVQTFDGSVGIRAGEEQVEFRIYRGSVVEVAKKSLEGPTFTVGGSERAWIDLLSSTKNDFVNRTQNNHFRSTGNNFQYLRIFKAIMLMIDEAQLAAAKEVPSA